jgi:hypothetical protein
MIDRHLFLEPKDVSEDFTMNEAELNRRFKLLLENLDSLNPVESGQTGSFICFNMILATMGCSSEPLPFMDEQYLEPLLTIEEYDNGTHDSVIYELFEKLPKVNLI